MWDIRCYYGLRILAGLLLLATVAGVLGCTGGLVSSASGVSVAAPGPSPSPAPTPTPVAVPAQALYVNAGHGIAGLKINADGSLSPLPGSPFITSLGISVLQANPSGRSILGSAIAPDGTVSIWVVRIDSQGALTSDPSPALSFLQSATTNVDQPVSVAFHPSGKMVYLSNFIGPLVLSAHPFDEGSGVIAPAAASQVQYPLPCGSAFCDFESVGIAGFSQGAEDQHLWVRFEDCGFHVDCTDVLQSWPILDGGATFGQQSDASVGSNSLSGSTIFNDGLLEVDEETCCSITEIGSFVFQNGSLVAKQGCTFVDAACQDAWAVVLHPNQALAIIAGVDGQLFTAIRDAAGNLALPVVSNRSIPPLANPALQLLFEQSGKYLYAIPNGTDLIYGFSVDANTGELQPVPGSPFAVTAMNISDFSRAIVVPLPASQ